MYKGINATGQVDPSDNYAGGSPVDGGHDPGYAGGTHSAQDAYGAAETNKGGTGYDSGENQNTDENVQESSFDQLVNEESEKAKDEDSSESETSLAPQAIKTMEDFSREIDVNQIRENIKRSKEDEIKKELEDAINGEKIERR